MAQTDKPFFAPLHRLAADARSKSLRSHIVQGFTIIELMIFLAISGVLFVSVMLLFSGQQQKVEFQQGVQDFDSKMQDIINNIADGYYSYNNAIQCTPGTTPNDPPDLSGGPLSKQGGNSGCIYIGQIVHFAPQGTNRDAVNIYSIAGNQKDPSTGLEISDITSAVPIAIANGLGASPKFDSSGPDTTEVFSLNSVHIGMVSYDNGTGAGWQPTSAIGFFSTFGVVNGAGDLQSGASNTQLIAMDGPGMHYMLDTNKAKMVQDIDLGLRKTWFVTNPKIAICLVSDVNGQVAVESLGGASPVGSTVSGTSTATRLDIYSNVAAANVAFGLPPSPPPGSGICQ